MTDQNDQAALPHDVDVAPIYSFKVPARRHLIARVGQSVASYWSELILEKDGVANGVRFQDQHPLIDRIVSRYFGLSVAGFKQRHHFPEGDRINNAKIAALMIKRCIADGAERLFVLDPAVDSVRRRDLVHGDFLYRLLMTVVEATPAKLRQAVPDPNLRKTLESDVRYCLTHRSDISEDWLAVTAFSYSIHYGEPKQAIA